MKSTMLGVFAVVLVGLLASCASTESKSPTIKQLLGEATAQNGRACIRQREIRGFGVLDHDIVSIDGGRRYYLATFQPRCLDLEISMRAIFKGRATEVCGGSADKMITENESCTINHIYEFNNRKEAFAIYDAVIQQHKQLKK